LIGSVNSKSAKVIKNHSQKFDNRVIVLGNCERSLSGFKYSTITHDIARDVLNLYLYLLYLLLFLQYLLQGIPHQLNFEQ